MALYTTHQEALKRINEELQCGICQKRVQKPRTLTRCSHSFCHACLEGSRVKSRRSKTNPIRNDQLECPTCRQITTLPNGQITDLPFSYTLHNVAEIVSTGPDIDERTVCSQHDGGVLNQYCDACNELLCAACIHDPKHRKHMKKGQIYLANDILPERLESLSSQLGPANQIVSQAEKLMQEVERKRNKVSTDRKQTTEQIDLFFDKIVEKVQQRRKALISAVEKDANTKLAILDEHGQSLQEKQKSTRETTANAKRLCEDRHIGALTEARGFEQSLQDMQQSLEHFAGQLQQQNLTQSLRFEEPRLLEEQISAAGVLNVCESGPGGYLTVRHQLRVHRDGNVFVDASPQANSNVQPSYKQTSSKPSDSKGYDYISMEPTQIRSPPMGIVTAAAPPPPPPEDESEDIYDMPEETYKDVVLEEMQELYDDTTVKPSVQGDMYDHFPPSSPPPSSRSPGATPPPSRPPGATRPPGTAPPPFLRPSPPPSPSPSPKATRPSPRRSSTSRSTLRDSTEESGDSEEEDPAAYEFPERLQQMYKAPKEALSMYEAGAYVTTNGKDYNSDVGSDEGLYDSIPPALPPDNLQRLMRPRQHVRRMSGSSAYEFVARPTNRAEPEIIQPTKVINVDQLREPDSTDSVFPTGICTNSVDTITITDMHNHCLRQVDQDGTFIQKFGGQGRAVWHFDSPTSVALNKENLYIVSQESGLAQKRTLNGDYYASFGRRHLGSPRGIAVSQISGRIYITDSTKKRVYVYGSNCKYVCPIGKYEDDIRFEHPVGVTFDTAGNLLVVDRGEVPCIWHINLPEVKLLGKIGERYLHYPSDIAITKDGSVVVTERGKANCVSMFSLDGELIRCFGKTGSNPGEFNGPSGVAVNSQGQIIVADQHNQRLQIFDLSESDARDDATES